VTRASAACHLLLVGGLLATGPAWAQEELPVDLELVLAVDVSGSIDAEEARQQRDGYVAAIADEAVVRGFVARISRADALSPTLIRGHAMRTYSGRPSSSMRFRTAAAIATSAA
jgi:2-methylcitrate dehydratase PrpD